MNSHIKKITFSSEKEWLKARKEYIGASDVSIILGVSRWRTNDGRIKTPRLLWAEKLGLDSMDCDNAATRYGKVMEEPARQAYQNMVGDVFEPICVLNEKYPHLMVSLDGLNVTDDRAVEIKNCSEYDHILAKDGKVPDKYYPQVQMQLMVTELPYIDYFSFHKGEGVIIKVEADQEYQLELNDKLKKFWKYVVDLKEPPLTENDYIEQGKQWTEIASKLYDIKQKKKSLCEEEKAIEESLKNLSNNNNSRSGGFMFTKSTSLGKIDYKSIPELLNRDLSEFRGRPSERWVLKRI